MDAIEGSEKVTAIFGRWPSFHDAEVHSLAFERTNEGFDVRAAIHTWESTGETDERGYHRLHKHTLVTFLFVDCDWPATDLRGFGRQNVIFGLETERDGEWILTAFEPCYGVEGTVRSRRVEVVDVRLMDGIPPRLREISQDESCGPRAGPSLRPGGFPVS